MKRDYLHTIYTEEDERGFYFSDVSENEKELQIAQLKKKRNKWRVILIVLLVPELLFFLISSIDDVKIFSYACIFISVFIFGLNIRSCSLKIRRIKREKEQYFNVEILERRPIECETRYNDQGPNSKHYFYPVIGRDVTTGYESLCYVTEEQYENSQLHDIIRILRFVKIKR